MNHSPSKVIRKLLIALGLGSDHADNLSWPVFASGEPSAPDNCITVYDTEGTSDGRMQPTGEAASHPGFQVRVRAVDHNTGWTKADAIRTAFAQTVYQDAVAIDATDYLVHAVTRIGNVLTLGKELTSKRSLFTLNATVVID